MAKKLLSSGEKWLDLGTIQYLGFDIFSGTVEFFKKKKTSTGDIAVLQTQL